MLELKLKGLKTRKSKMEIEIYNLRYEKSKIESELSEKYKKIQEIDTEILKLSDRSIIITEHAILRYIERVLKINIEELKDAILDKESENLIKFMKPKKLKRDGYSLIVSGNTITTIISE